MEQLARRPLKPRKFEGMAFIFSFLLGSLLGFRFIGGYLFLVYTYGFSHVHDEHLYLIKMGKVDPWIVSNGDKIAGGRFPWFLVVAGISLAISLLTFLLIYRFLPEKKNNVQNNE